MNQFRLLCTNKRHIEHFRYANFNGGSSECARANIEREKDIIKFQIIYSLKRNIDKLTAKAHLIDIDLIIFSKSLHNLIVYCQRSLASCTSLYPRNGIVLCQWFPCQWDLYTHYFFLFQFFFLLFSFGFFQFLYKSSNHLLLYNCWLIF